MILQDMFDLARDGWYTLAERESSLLYLSKVYGVPVSKLRKAETFTEAKRIAERLSERNHANHTD
jgi:hypothetical protein